MGGDISGGEGCGSFCVKLLFDEDVREWGVDFCTIPLLVRMTHEKISKLLMAMFCVGVGGI